MQIIHDRARIAELALQKYTQNEIIEVLENETGIRLSQQQISYDLSKVKKSWMKTQHENYDLLMQRELARVDALETEIWRALRDSVKDKERSIIEKARRKVHDADDAEYEMVIIKAQEAVEQTVANPAFFARIHDCQKERRQLLGLYAPQQIDVQKTIVIKGYKDISPDDWDNIVEGELVN